MAIPSLQTLRAFDAAGRLQSYSLAGEEMGLTHGAISRRIRDLEALTGQRLFGRQGNRMIPTPEGVRLGDQVRIVLSLLGGIFPSQDVHSKGHVTVSLFPALARWLVPRLAPLRLQHPDLDLRLDLSPNLVEIGNGIDAAIRYGFGEWPGTVSRLLAKEVLFPVCSPAYLAEHPLDDPADLLNGTLLRHPWHSWTAWFQAAGVVALKPGDGPEYSDSSMLLEAAMAGEGVALARGLGVVDALRAGSLVRPFSASISDSRAYFFVVPRGKGNAALETIEGWLAEKLQNVEEELPSRSAAAAKASRP